jgi:hypothetical protein
MGILGSNGLGKDMRKKDVSVDHLFRLADRGLDPTRELDIIHNIHRYVQDAHLFAMSYANYAQAVRELCTGEPEPVSRFLARWPHRKVSL